MFQIKVVGFQGENQIVTLDLSMTLNVRVRVKFQSTTPDIFAE